MRWIGLLISCIRWGKLKVSNKCFFRILIYVLIDFMFFNFMDIDCYVEIICLLLVIIFNGVFKILSDNREIVKNNFCEIIILMDLIVLYCSLVDELFDGLLEFLF